MKTALLDWIEALPSGAAARLFGALVGVQKAACSIPTNRNQAKIRKHQSKPVGNIALQNVSHAKLE